MTFLVVVFAVVEERGPSFKNRKEPYRFDLLGISLLQMKNCHPYCLPHQVYTSVKEKDHKSKRQTRTKGACLSSLLVTQDTASLLVSPGTPMTAPGICPWATKAVHLQKEAAHLEKPASFTSMHR